MLGLDGTSQRRGSGVSPPDSAWRASTPGSALGTLLRSPEPPGDPLQEPGSDFRSALQCAHLPVGTEELEQMEQISTKLSYFWKDRQQVL